MSAELATLSAGLLQNDGGGGGGVVHRTWASRRGSTPWSGEWQRSRRRKTCCGSTSVLPSTASADERRAHRVEKVLKLYRERALVEDATFWISFLGLLIVMLQINTVDQACRDRQARFSLLPQAQQADMLARWQPPANVDALFDIFALESGHTTEFRSAAQAERNCSLFTSYEDVTDVCWCTGFSLSLPRYGLFDRNFWVADNKETEGKRFVLALQIFTTATAIVMVILVVARFIVNARIIKARGDRDRTTVERSSGQSRTLEVRLRIAEVCRKKTVTRLCRLVFELCLVGIHVPVLCGDWYISSWAWINGWSDQTADRPVFFHYHATDLGFLLWLRLMWPLFRSLRNHSVFSGSEQARALALKLEREDNSQKTGAMFAFKMMLRQQPIRLMVILTSIDVLATSSMVWTLEKAVPYGIRRWTDCVWLTVVTMSTVGYGDLYAVTSEARIVLFFGGLLFGTLIVAVMTASFVDWAALAPSDVRITNEVQRRIWERKVDGNAAKVIQTVVRLYRLRRYFDGVPSRLRCHPDPTMLLRMKWVMRDANNGRKLRGLQIRLYYQLAKLRKTRRLPAHLVEEDADGAPPARGPVPRQARRARSPGSGSSGAIVRTASREGRVSASYGSMTRSASSGSASSLARDSGARSSARSTERVAGAARPAASGESDVASVLHGQAELLAAIETMSRSLSRTNEKLHALEVAQCTEERQSALSGSGLDIG